MDMIIDMGMKGGVGVMRTHIGPKNIQGMHALNYCRKLWGEREAGKEE